MTTLQESNSSRALVLLNEWDYEKNSVAPKEISTGSKKKIWWKCERGHSWDASVYNRFSLLAGCHYCTNRKVLPGYNDLNSLRPDIAKDWDFDKNSLRPDEVTCSSGKKVHWVCSKEHKYEAKISNRTKKDRPTGCPICAGQKVDTNSNYNLLSLFPMVASLWDYNKNNTKPEDYLPKSNNKVWWLCSANHSYFMRISDKVIKDPQGKNCPVCSGYMLVPGVNDFATKYPDLLMDWDYDKNSFLGINPNEIIPSYTELVWWRCDKKHSYNMSPKDMVRGYCCPICSSRRIISGINDFSTLSPIILKEWDFEKNNVSPSTLANKSNTKVWWKCNFGHSWCSTIIGRSLYGYGCPTCSNNGISSAEKEIVKYIKSIYQGSVLENSRSVIPPKEVNIYIPDRKIAIEYNGLYWHSTAMSKNSNAHYEKWKSCNNKGLQLITIWEDDWLHHAEVVKRILSHKLGVSTQSKVAARQTYIADIDSKEAFDFLDKNHIQGKASGAQYVALRSKKDDTLVAVMVIKILSTEILISRYATSCIVQGGFSKLLKEVEKRFLNKKISSFSDNEVSNGELYRKNGFIIDYDLAPDYKYVYQGMRKHKFLFRKENFKTNPNLKYVEGLTEKELAELNGLYRVYDSGKIKWIKYTK